MDNTITTNFYYIPMILSMIFLFLFWILLAIEYRDDSLYENKTRQCAMRILILLSIVCAIIPVILLIISVLINLWKACL